MFTACTSRGDTVSIQITCSQSEVRLRRCHTESIKGLSDVSPHGSPAGIQQRHLAAKSDGQSTKLLQSGTWDLPGFAQHRNTNVNGIVLPSHAQ